MGVVTEEAVYKRIKDVNNASQETVETIALWIMHHKDKISIEIIVDCWLKCFKTAPSDQHRIALFYIMNHVVQQARHKHVDAFIPAFQPAVLSAVDIGRNYESVKRVMERCIGLFGERQIFTHESVTTMKNKLNADEIGDSCVDLESQDVVKRLRNFIKTRKLAADGMKVVKMADFDFKTKIKRDVRNKAEAIALRETAQTSLDQVISLRRAMEAGKKKMLEVVETLELAKRMYSQQLYDVTIMEAAYQQFLHGIRKVNKELQEMELSGIYPGATPPRDAPSPTANDDIYATGVETVLQNFRAPGASDNLETADMDIEEDDRVPLPMPPLFVGSNPSTSQTVNVPSFPFPPPTNLPSGAGLWLPPPSAHPPQPTAAPMTPQFPMNPAQFMHPPPNFPLTNRSTTQPVVDVNQETRSDSEFQHNMNLQSSRWDQKQSGHRSHVGSTSSGDHDVGRSNDDHRRHHSGDDRRNSYYDPRKRGNRESGYGRGGQGYDQGGGDRRYNH